MLHCIVCNFVFTDAMGKMMMSHLSLQWRIYILQMYPQFMCRRNNNVIRLYRRWSELFISGCWCDSSDVLQGRVLI